MFNVLVSTGAFFIADCDDPSLNIWNRRFPQKKEYFLGLEQLEDEQIMTVLSHHNKLIKNQIFMFFSS